MEKGFSAVAVEADFPDAYRINNYVRGTSSDSDAVDALSGFKRFPAWMWRNADVLDFVGWLRSYNDDLGSGSAKIGFYGLDLYSLYTSISAVLDYLQKVDPAGAARARERYSCFDHFGDDTQTYGYSTAVGLAKSCEDEVVNQLTEMNQRATELANRDGRVAEDEFFTAEQNARLVKNAEQYYRTMYRSDVSSWNLAINTWLKLCYRSKNTWSDSIVLPRSLFGNTILILATLELPRWDVAVNGCRPACSRGLWR